MAARPSSPTSTEAVAERLRLTREASGMKQAAFCRLVGVTPQAWNNYETGARRISLDQAIRICAVTGVTLDWIYRGLSANLPMEMASKILALQEQPPRKRA
jgi:transcriptional regulator with XRE-family HTH domain